MTRFIDLLYKVGHEKKTQNKKLAMINFICVNSCSVLHLTYFCLDSMCHSIVSDSSGPFSVWDEKNAGHHWYAHIFSK